MIISSRQYGFDFSDSNYDLIAIDASPEAVADSLLELDPRLKECQDVEISISKFREFIAVFKMINYEWTVVMSVPGGFTQNEADRIQSFAQQFEQVIMIMNTSTGDYSCFSSFKSGQLQAQLSYIDERIRGYEKEKITEELMDSIEASGQELIVDAYFTYGLDFSFAQVAFPINQSCHLTHEFLTQKRIFIPDLNSHLFRDSVEGKQVLKVDKDFQDTCEYFKIYAERKEN